MGLTISHIPISPCSLCGTRRSIGGNNGREGNTVTAVSSAKLYQTPLNAFPLFSMSPHQAELYYLRLLLHHKAGAVSYEDLRTVNGEECPAFQEECHYLGPLSDDSEKDAVIEEATASSRFGAQLNHVFATILLYYRTADPIRFWENTKRYSAVNS